jgi:iron complex outermembrane recepter protein
MLKKALYISAALIGVMAQAAFAETTDASASGASKETMEAVVVTGSRGQARTVTTSPAPIDVLSSDALAQLSGGGGLRDALSQALPSFQAQQWVGSSSWNSVMRPAGLRGLGGADVLVLVDGKRRHNGAEIDLSTGNLNNGANPVDLDLIPSAAIDHIEVLRDGASAQYGSDAIAGVINIVLKRKDKGATLSVSGGQHYKNDGATYGVNGSISFALPNDGSTTLAVSYNGTERATRGQPVTGTFYFTTNGAADPRETTVDRYTYKGGLPKSNTILFSEDSEMTFGGVTVYNTGTFGYRNAFVGQAGRKPNTNQNIVAVYPDGYTPYYTLTEYDFQDAVGARGNIAGWNWDLSTTYGSDYALNGSKNSINASLGTASPKRFDTFSATFEQLTSNLDLTRAYDIDGRALQVSFGLEHRYEHYQTRSKDAAAYTDGGYIYPSGTTLAGQHAAVGAQGAIIVAPGDQANLSRNAVSAYVDLDYDLAPGWSVAAAGRFEHYDDSAGDTAVGKFSTRYEITPELALRATVSNGFRAPSLAQEGFSQSSAQYRLVTGGYQFVQSKTATVDSALGKALGAKPLTPEESLNYSAGVVFTPTDSISATLDAYSIDLYHRVVLTGLLSGTGVNAILVANGFASNQQVQYFANAVNTRTQGLDFVSTYRQGLDEFGNIRFTAGLNYNVTSITKIADTPSQLAGLGLTLFDRASQGGMTVLTPKTKVILGADWSLDQWGVNVKETRYGSFSLLNNSAASDQHYGAKWLTDVNVSYAFDSNMQLTVGADNIFDVYPDKNTVSNSSGLSPYGNSPFGYYGGYYYARITFNQ